jgi:hypothetical protein
MAVVGQAEGGRHAALGTAGAAGPVLMLIEWERKWERVALRGTAARFVVLGPAAAGLGGRAYGQAGEWGGWPCQRGAVGLTAKLPGPHARGPARLV